MNRISIACSKFTNDVIKSMIGTSGKTALVTIVLVVIAVVVAVVVVIPSLPKSIKRN